jgi:hypothetical protein
VATTIARFPQSAPGGFSQPSGRGGFQPRLPLSATSTSRYSSRSTLCQVVGIIPRFRSLSNPSMWSSVHLLLGESTAVCSTRCSATRSSIWSIRSTPLQVSVCASHRLPKLPLPQDTCRATKWIRLKTNIHPMWLLGARRKPTGEFTDRLGVGGTRLELVTSTMSTWRSSQLS